MLTWEEWNHQKDTNLGVNEKWKKLVDGHRIHFSNRFSEQDLMQDDKMFVVSIFEKFKYVSQLNTYNIFQIKEGGVIFQVGYFKNTEWSASIENEETREVTEKFKITESKINSLIELFKKAIQQKTFKNILPVIKK